MSTLAAAAPRRHVSDRLNPILVKEVRQALRGRYFKVMFWLTLAVATVVGLMVVATGAVEEDIEAFGQPFFVFMFACMSAAVHAFTPFWAYLSTSAEWDENTHDLLVLSNLRPLQIVLGKLLSALTQALLYYSTFGPFLVFAYLLNGVDLLSISVLLVCSLASCVGLSLVGIALASLARVKAARGILMAVFGGVLALVWGGSLGAAVGITESPQDLRDPEGQMAVALFLTFALLVGVLFGAIACARLAHEEENRSTGLRVLCTCIVLLAGAWGGWLHAQFGDEETAYAVQFAAASLLLPAWLFFFTEHNALGRRTTKHVAAGRRLALLSVPFLPGGGRGVSLFAVHFLCALLGGVLALQSGSGPKRDDLVEVVGMVSLFYGYAFVFLALPSTVASFFAVSDRARFVTRIVIVVLVPLVILLPALLGLLFGNKDWMEMRHPLNPVWIMDKLMSSDKPGGVVAGMAILAIGVVLTLLLNAKRVVSGVLEVLAASRARREREQLARS